MTCLLQDHLKVDLTLLQLRGLITELTATESLSSVAVASTRLRPLVGLHVVNPFARLELAAPEGALWPVFLT